MKDGGLAFPGSRYEMLRVAGENTKANVTYPGMSLRDYALVHLTAAWVEVIGNRYGMDRYISDGYTDEGAAHEANRLAEIQADEIIAEREKSNAQD